MLEPQGRVIMVSGASRGIGRAVVERLLARGYSVSAGMRDPGALTDLAGENLVTARVSSPPTSPPGSGRLSVTRMIAPEDLAVLAETVIALPNTASVAEMLVNCRHEDML